ncbi:hypothetical protein CYMTET_35394, partial [Cymbomonas tetramitiformis]
GADMAPGAGCWKEDQKHGQGKWTSKEETYEGSYAANMRDGQGTCLYASGDQYRGEWKADKRLGVA